MLREPPEYSDAAGLIESQGQGIGRGCQPVFEERPSDASVRTLLDKNEGGAARWLIDCRFNEVWGQEEVGGPTRTRTLDCPVMSTTHASA